MNEDTVRVLRVLEYVGPRSWVETTMSRNAVKGTHLVSPGCWIREATIGDFPEILETKVEEEDSI